MKSKSVLQEALMEFEGSCVIVSHDRDFLDPLVNKVVEFTRGAIKTYPGNITDFIDRVKDRRDGIDRPPGGGEGKTRQGEKERKRSEAEYRQRLYALTRPIQKKIEKMEITIQELESRKMDIEARMIEPGFYSDGEQVRKRNAEYAALQKEIENTYYQWNEAMKELEQAEQNLQNS